MKTLGTFFFFIFSALYLFHLSSWQSHPDEMLIINGASAILLGKVPYRDFFEFTGPVPFYYLALFFKFLGENTFALGVARTFLAMSILVLVFYCGKRLSNEKNALLASSLFLFISWRFWPVVSHHWVATLFSLASLFFLDMTLENRRFPLKVLSRTGYPCLAGFFSSLAFLSAQNTGPVIFLIIISYIFLLKIVKFSIKTESPGAFKFAPAFFFGFFISLGAFIGLLHASSALANAINSMFLWTLEKYAPYHSGITPFSDLEWRIRNDVSPLVTFESFSLAFLSLLLAFSFLPLLSFLTSLLKNNAESRFNSGYFTAHPARLLFASLWGSIYFLAAFPGPTTTRLTFSVPLALPLLIPVWRGFLTHSALKGLKDAFSSVFFALAILSSMASELHMLNGTELMTEAGPVLLRPENASDFAKAYTGLKEILSLPLYREQKHVFFFPYPSHLRFFLELPHTYPVDVFLPGYTESRQLEKTAEFLKQNNIKIFVLVLTGNEFYNAWARKTLISFFFSEKKYTLLFANSLFEIFALKENNDGEAPATI